MYFLKYKRIKIIPIVAAIQGIFARISKPQTRAHMFLNHGFLVFTNFTIKNKEEFVDNICKILNNKALRLRLSKNATKWADTFNWETAATKSLAIVGSIVKNG